MSNKIIRNHLRNLRIDAKNYTKTLNEETQKQNKAKQKKVNEVIRLKGFCHQSPQNAKKH